MPAYLLKALIAIIEIAADPKVIDVAHDALKMAFDRGDIDEADYQASIKARDDAWERVKAAHERGD